VAQVGQAVLAPVAFLAMGVQEVQAGQLCQGVAPAPPLAPLGALGVSAPAAPAPHPVVAPRLLAQCRAALVVPLGGWIALLGQAAVQVWATSGGAVVVVALWVALQPPPPGSLSRGRALVPLAAAVAAPAA
jgi:hypothetical protein